MKEYIDKNKLKQHYAWWQNEDKEIFDQIIDLQPVVYLPDKPKRFKCVFQNLKFKELMIAKGLNQKALSDATGVTEGAISYYVKGKRSPRPETLEKLAKILGVTPNDLLQVCIVGGGDEE
jgi:DNA-binding Xre family transcriptional regulator